jgi:tRNA(adenine34) deaminase
MIYGKKIQRDFKGMSVVQMEFLFFRWAFIKERFPTIRTKSKKGINRKGFLAEKTHECFHRNLTGIISHSRPGIKKKLEDRSCKFGAAEVKSSADIEVDMDRDEHFMKEALLEAQMALQSGEVPVGAVLVEDDKVIARGHNKPLSTADPTAHAEIVAIREASQKIGNYRLSGCDLYVTLEPCAMCLGAAIHTRLRRVVFGALDPKGGAVESVMSFPFEKMNHRIEIKGGVLASECGKILKSFFENKR